MLELKNISFISNDDENKEILRDISLQFEEGKVYVITGPNGSGKSTLVKTIIGINHQSSGRIFLDGKDISNLEIDERVNLGISYAFQKPVTFKGIKVRELLDVASKKQNDFNALCNFLSQVGLCAKEYINRFFDDKLSGGEQKRIELALALARNTKINIFDEPEAGIDLWSFDNLTNIFKNMKHTTNIIVSHQTKILEIADFVILLKNGKVEKIGFYDEVKPFIESSTCGKLRGDDE